MPRFRELIKLASSLPMDEFLIQFPHPFLLYSEKPNALAGLVAHTRLVEGPSGQSQMDRFSDVVLDLEVVLPNPHPNKEFPRKVLVGRDPNRDLMLKHSTVSSRHACFLFEPSEDSFKLVDSGSTNGTLVRGHAIQPAQPILLRDGDVITFGQVSCLFLSPKGAYRFIRQYKRFQEALNE